MWLTNEAPYIFNKRGVYYFSRRVPVDLKCHYTLPRIVFSLRTKSFKAAKSKVTSLAAKLDEDWLTLRWRTTDDPFRRFLVERSAGATIVSSAPLMSEAKNLYVQLSNVSAYGTN